VHLTYCFMLILPTPASDIVEAILRDNESDGISLEMLRKNLPVRWDEQRRRWTRTGIDSPGHGLLNLVERLASPS